jgi:hypothetical protein
MDQQTQELVGAGEQAVARLVERWRQDGPLCQHSPRTVAQVGPTGKWLLHAVARLPLKLTLSRPGDGS